jgi:DNA-binding PucR family transcriptional regulator
MVFPASDGTVIVFKSIRAGREGFLGAFESEILDYVHSVGEALGWRDPVSAWVGAFQTDLGRYRAAYRQATWLCGHVPEPDGGPAFLFDYILEYLSSMIPRSEYVTALDATLELLSRETVLELGPPIKALANSALNCKEAAARLGVHRNTFSARMDRFAGLLGRDPRSDPKALDLIRLVVRYAELHSR